LNQDKFVTFASNKLIKGIIMTIYFKKSKSSALSLFKKSEPQPVAVKGQELKCPIKFSIAPVRYV